MSLQHIGTNTIETIRLVLRRFQADDAEKMFYNWAGNPHVCKYLSWGPHKDIDASLKRIISWVSSYSFNNSYVWAIVLKNTEEAIGSISVELSNDSTQSCEVGYCIGEAYWNRGIMTEALRAVLHYLFFEVGYQTIRAKHDVMNIGSGKVMQKAGMQFEKYEYRAGTRRDGSTYDCAVYVKHKEDE